MTQDTHIPIKVHRHEWGTHPEIYLLAEGGMAMLGIYGEQALFHDFIIFPEYRGNGIGTRLLETAEAVAREEEGVVVMFFFPNCDEWVEEMFLRHGFRPDVCYQRYGKTGWSKYLTE